MDLFIIIWFILATIIGALIIPLVKEYINTSNNMLLVVAITLHIILVFVYVKLFANNNISTFYTFTKIFSIIIVVAFGVLWFNEKLSYKNIIGIILAIVSLGLLL